MGNMTTTSVFEQVPPAQWVADDDYVFAILDAHPVSPGHTLVIPKRRITSWFDATEGELSAMTRMVALLKARLDEQHLDHFCSRSALAQRPSAVSCFCSPRSRYGSNDVAHVAVMCVVSR